MARRVPAWALLVSTLVASLAGCHHGQTGASTTASGAHSPTVVIPARAGEQRVTVELARTEGERARGLMFRQELAADRGMLFLFESAQPLTFWMKNTYIPLDMIFLDSERRIVHCEANAEPLTLTGRGPKVPAQYVIEVRGGWCAERGVEAGPTPVRFIDVD